NRRRSAAIFLLVCCLLVSAISPFASQSLSAERLTRQWPAGVTAFDVALDYVLGIKVEKSSGHESQLAVIGLPSRLLRFAGDGVLLHGANDETPPALFASAFDIRGPPQSARS